MFEINEDKTINITRGDIGAFTVDALNEAGEKYIFQKGDVVRIKVTEKKACENVMFQKDFVVEEETEQVELLLTEEETKIGEVISKPTDYWYEIELNPLTNPQTIIGYDEDGAKIFKLFPEGKDAGSSDELTPEDIPLVDDELDLTSDRPVQNQAIARAFLNIQEEISNISIGGDITKEDLDALETDIDTNKTNIAANTGKIEDLTNNTQELANAQDTHTADKNNPHNVTAEQINCGETTVKGAIDDLKSLVCNIEKISINETFKSSTTLTDVWTYTASKKCLLNASVSCGHYGGRPYQMALYKNGATDPFSSNNEGSETTSFKSIPLNIVLEKNEKVVMKARYNNATTNRYFIEGYVQYLE